MVDVAIGIGIYSYLIYALGLAGFLYKITVLILTAVFLGILRYWLSRSKHDFGWIKEIKKDKIVLFSVIILVLQILVNFLGAISPELSFDALWYHLTPAKIFAENHRIFYLQGNLLWAANAPHLIDNLYAAALTFSNEILAKLIHFSFGLLSAGALFNLLARYFNIKISIIGVLIFYTMLIVGWQSTTAYIDLGRTFFEILALDYFLKWFEGKDKEGLILSAIMVGLAISSKMLAIGSLAAFSILILLFQKKGKLKTLVIYNFFAILVVLPWFVQSFINTGNPLFPVFGNFKDLLVPAFSVNNSTFFYYLSRLSLLPWHFINSTLKPDDIISPIFLILFPINLWLLKNQKFVFKMILVFIVFGFLFLYGNPNRYFLPYLPVLTLFSLGIFNTELIKRVWFKNFLYFLIFSSVILNFGSRVLATRKFLPYLRGKQTKAEFLSKNLNYAYGDFYDVDGYFSKNIDKNDLVLVYGIHNLYYLNFPYIHESMAKKGTFFTHLLVGNNDPLPERFKNKLLIYENPITRVSLYILAERF